MDVLAEEEAISRAALVNFLIHLLWRRRGEIGLGHGLPEHVGLGRVVQFQVGEGWLGSSSPILHGFYL